MLFVRLLERPSRKAFEASFATFTEVTFLAINILIKLNTEDESATILS